MRLFQFDKPDRVSPQFVRPRFADDRISEFCREQSGFVVVMTALLLPVLILIVAFSIETSFAFSDQSRMQAAADNAARYAAILRSQSRSSAYITSGAKAVARSNGFIDGQNATVTVNVPPTSGNFIQYQSSVEVIIDRSRDGLFPGILNKSSIAQRTRAVATWDMSPCVVALSQASSGSAGSYGVSTNGSFTFTAGCGIYSNSQSTRDSMQVQSGQIWANGFYIAGVGDYSTQTESGLRSLDGASPGLVTKGASVFALPQQFANLAQKLDAGVPTDDGNTVINPTSQCVPNSNNVTSSPATTCTYTQTTTTTSTTPVYGKGADKNKIIGYETTTTTTTTPVTVSMFTSGSMLRSDLYYDTISTSSTVNLDPGKRYYVNGINMNSGSAVINGLGGNTILVVGSNPEFFMAGGSSLNINPPTYQQDNVYYGVSLMSGLTNLTSADVTGGSGGAEGGMNGVIVFPNASMKLAGGSSTSTKCQTFYVAAVVINGSGGIGSGCNSTLVNMSAFRTRNLVE